MLDRESGSDHREPNSDVLTALTANEDMMSHSLATLTRKLMDGGADGRQVGL